MRISDWSSDVCSSDRKFDRDELKGLRFSIQGVGNVGYRLAQHLHAAGAQLWVTDIYAPAVERCVKDFGATAVTMDALHALDVDVFAPCALGALLNAATIPQPKATDRKSVVEGKNGSVRVDLSGGRYIDKKYK